MAQLFFLGTWLVATLFAFLLLRSFVESLTWDERVRTSQDFVEDVVGGFSELQKPLETLAAIIALSEKSSRNEIAGIIRSRESEYESFSQIVWFRKAESGGWAFAPLFRGRGADVVTPDSQLLSVLLARGAMRSSHTVIFDDVKWLQTRQESQNPHIVSSPFAFIRAVEPGNEAKGFLMGIVSPRAVFGETWLSTRRSLSFVRVRDMENNRVVFLFGREPGTDFARAGTQQVYEFPLAGRKWELTSVFAQDTRSRFLEFFPYVVLAFGGLFVVAGGLYIRGSYRQAAALAGMNEALEQKNYELEAEMSERERLYQALRDAEAENRAVIDSVGDVIFETDRDGQLIFLNRAWTKITGFEVEHSLGLELFQMIHPQDQAVQRQAFKNLIRGTKREMRVYTRLRMSDGNFRAAELALSVIQQDERKGFRYIGTFTDIEERRRAERALSEAEKKYRNIVENAAGGIYQLTPEGLFLSANPAMARILGYDSPEQILREVRNANESIFIDNARRQVFYRDLEYKETIYNHEGQMRRRNGTVIWVNENARVVRDENGQVLFIEGSIEDITKRKESDAAIREAKMHSDMANRAKSEFLSNMSHELRTPLNSIIGFSEIIRDAAFGPVGQDIYKDYARDIHQSGKKLLRVINEILDISKIEAGERQLNEGIVNMSGVVDSALDMLAPKIESSRMRIAKTMEGIPDVIGEELALKQVVVNLLSNAVKFTPDGGRVTIAAHVGRDGRFHLSITDTGIGLDEYEIKKALSPFGQLDNNLNRSGSGTGLGLTLVDALVKIHGGEFELLSQKGIGTTANVILPADRIVRKKRQIRQKPYVSSPSVVSGDASE